MDNRTAKSLRIWIARAIDNCSRVKRNRGTQAGYQPGYAHEQARARRWTGSRLDRDAGLRGLVLGQLQLGWSPDNGTEVAQHYRLNDQLAIRTCFCDPHSPWQKGSVESTIGHLRGHLPRKTNLDTINPGSLDILSAALNNTPRKCLGSKTPAEVFSERLLRFKRDSTPALRSG